MTKPSPLKCYLCLRLTNTVDYINSCANQAVVCNRIRIIYNFI
ncbi:MAG: hypothetical protein OFPI_26960 [Osedax symbiont Rs2]|nr:MAG: hypothetical protein OFPI_26960 [Osedax symbiont Rs2]